MSILLCGGLNGKLFNKLIGFLKNLVFLNFDKDMYFDYIYKIVFFRKKILNLELFFVSLFLFFINKKF